MNFDPLICRAIPLWRPAIAQELACGLPAGELVALVYDCTATGGRTHTTVVSIAGARRAFDSIEQGLSARVFDTARCPPGPLGVALVKDAAGRVHSEPFALDLPGEAA